MVRLTSLIRISVTLLASSSLYGQTSSVVGVKLRSNRLSDAVKGKAYAELLSFPDFSYTYYPSTFSARVTAKMHYDTVSIVGTLPSGLTASAAKLRCYG